MAEMYKVKLTVLKTDVYKRQEHGTPGAATLIRQPSRGSHFSLARMCLNRFLPTTTSRNRLRIWLSHGKHPMI